MASRITQVAAEIIGSGNPNARITQVAIEVISDAEGLDVLAATGPTEEVGISDTASSVIAGTLLTGPTEEVGVSDGQASASITEVLTVTVPAEQVGVSDGQASGAGYITMSATAAGETVGMRDVSPSAPITAATAAAGAFFGDRPLLLLKLALRTGTEYESDIPVNHPSWEYQPEVLRWGSHERAIPIPPGPPIIGGGSIELSDTPDLVTGVQKFREKFHTITPRRSTATLKTGFEGGNESLFPISYVGELLSPTFPADRVILPFRDRWDRWLKMQIPGLGNRTNFPNMPMGLDEFFVPIVFGCVTSLESNPQGALRLQLCDTTTNDYAANQTLTNNICGVYRKLPGAQVFTLLACEDFTKVTEPRTINGITYNLTYVRFPSAQPDGTEIRADIDGASFRGQFGSMPEVSGTLRNIVDHTINLLYYLFSLQGEQVEFDTASFAVARQRYVDAGLVFDGAIDRPMSFGSALSLMMSSGNFWLIPDRFGRIGIKTLA